MNAFRLKYMGLFPTTGKDFVSQMSAMGDQIRDGRVELRVAEQTRDGIRRQLEDQTKERTAAVAENPAYRPKIAVPELDGRIDALKRQIDELLRNLHRTASGCRRQQETARKTRGRTRPRDRKPPQGCDRTSRGGTSGDPVTEQLKVALNESEANITTARARLSEFEARYPQLKPAAETLPKIDTEWTQLNRDYDIQKRQYENLVSRRETAAMTGKLEDAGVAEFRIIDPPRVTPTPVAPNRILLLLGLIVGSLGAGLATAFAVSQVQPTFHDGRVLREIAGRPLLGMVSMIASPEFRTRRRRPAVVRRRRGRSHGIVRGGNRNRDPRLL